VTSPAPPAQQPASDPQQAESVDLKPVEAAFAAALLLLLLRWATIRVTWIRELTLQITEALKTGGIASLTTLNVNTDGPTDVVHKALIDYAATAAHHVVAEAAKQGATITPATVAPGDLEEQAKVAAELLATALENSATAEAARVHPPASVIEEQAKEAAKEAAPDGEPSKEAVKKAVEEAHAAAANDTADAVEKYLHTLSDAQMHYVLGAVLTGAQNQATIATFLEAHGAGHDVDIFASEVLDHATCLPCKEVHGRLLARAGTGDFSLLLSLYPVRGYIDCLGRDRCRGTIVGIWVKVGDE
jgi:hypothetical protein